MTTTSHIQINQAAYLNPKHGQFNLWWQATFFMLALFAVTLLLWWVDPRQLEGVSVWAKPLKFLSSLALYFVTLALLAGFLPVKNRNGRGWRWATHMAVGAGVFEIIYIVIQAARGRASHYNNSTPLESIMYGMMGLGAVILVAVSLYLGWLLYRNHRSTEPSKFKLAAAWGLMLGSVLTLLTAGVMSNLPSHFAGTPAADTWLIPVMGWSLSGGDLRIPHFFATHLMQFLPLYGLWLQRQSISLAVARQKIMIVSVAYCVAVLVWFAASFMLWN